VQISISHRFFFRFWALTARSARFDPSAASMSEPHALCACACELFVGELSRLQTRVVRRARTPICHAFTPRVGRRGAPRATSRAPRRSRGGSRASNRQGRPPGARRGLPHSCQPPLSQRHRRPPAEPPPGRTHRSTRTRGTGRGATNEATRKTGAVETVGRVRRRSEKGNGMAQRIG